MIDTFLADLMDKTQPRMNHDICSGLATIQMREVEDYLNQVMRGSSQSCPAGLEYTGLTRCTPYEEYREITRPMKPKRGYELSKSDVYMVKFNFKFQGIEMRPRYSLLPFVGDGGLIHLNGTQYKVTPVLGGRIFNIEKNVVFMTTPKSPMAFDRTSVACLLNDRTVIADGVHSRLYNMYKTDRPTKITSMLMHYILAEHGLAHTLNNMFGLQSRVGYKELDDLMETGEWCVFKSRQLPPLTRSMRQDTVCEIRIAIPAKLYNTNLNPIIASIFYIMDQCSDSIHLEDLDKPELWLRLLYRFIFKRPDVPSTEYEKMVAHLDSVKQSLDPLTQRLLLQEGVSCGNIFELFKYLQFNIHDMIIHNDVGSMYDMELTTVKHLVYHIVCNINNVMYELKRLPPERISMDSINDIMNKSFHKDAIFTVSKHAELSSDDIASDCKLYGATCNIISQSKAATAGISGKHTNTINDQAQLLHQSQVEVGTYLMMSKAEPTARGKASCFLHMPHRHFVTANPRLEKTIDALGKLLAMK